MAKLPKDMTASEINRELDRLGEKRSKLNDEFIHTGRGYEKFDETMKKKDPLALRFQALVDRSDALHNEISLRMGPGRHSRLPTGKMFGPRKSRDTRSITKEKPLVFSSKVKAEKWLKETANFGLPHDTGRGWILVQFAEGLTWAFVNVDEQVLLPDW